MNLENLDLPNAIGFSGAIELSRPDEGIIAGYGTIFGELVETHAMRIEAGAFTKSLARHQAQGTRPAMLWSHSPAEPIGRWTTLREDARGLRVEGQLNLKTARGREAFHHVKAGDVDGLSVGFLMPDGGVHRGSDGIVTVHEADLYEISVVTVPANRPARISQVHHLETRGELERLLRDAGLSRGAAGKIAHGGWPALTTADDDDFSPLIATLHRNAAELAERLKG